MKDEIIIYSGGALIAAFILWKLTTGNGKNGDPEVTLQNRIDYTRSAMYTAYDSQDVDEYLHLQRELQLLELKIS